MYVKPILVSSLLAAGDLHLFFFYSSSFEMISSSSTIDRAKRDWLVIFDAGLSERERERETGGLYGNTRSRELER